MYGIYGAVRNCDQLIDCGISEQPMPSDSPKPLLAIAQDLFYCTNYMQEEKTPVHYAAERGHVNVLKILIQKYHANKLVKAGVSTNCVSYCYTFL